jgi:uncharacterized protein YhbP (UPF0306 family)
MIKEHQVITAFLDNEKLAVITTMIDNSQPHSAVVYFSFDQERNEFYFSVDRTSRKARFLGASHTAHGSLVIGFSDTEWKTFQLEGVVQIIADEDQVADAKKIHYAKNPSSQKYEHDGDTIFLVFKPSWYRYTDFLKKPVKIIEVGE